MIQKSLRRLALRSAYRLSKREYLRLILLLEDRRFANFSHPVTFNEKLNAYKLATANFPAMPRLVDKIEVKKIVADRIGAKHLIPTLWHGQALPQRNERDWPVPYVIKSSHGSGHAIFVRKQDPDWKMIESTTSQWLQKKFGHFAYEWPYLKLQPRLLVEPDISEGDQPPVDYKFFCFDGEPKFIQLDSSRFKNHRRNIYDLAWNELDFEINKPRISESVAPPSNLREMIEIASKLARHIPFVRVDLYSVSKQVLFGEMTFFPEAGIMKFRPKSAQAVMSSEWTCGHVWGKDALGN